MTNDLHIPDFSGDDFANDKEILKLRAKAKAYEDMVDACLTTIGSRFGAVEPSDKTYDSFSMFSSLGAAIDRSLRYSEQQRNLDVFIARYQSSIPTGRVHNSGTESYLFGSLELRRSFPKTYISRETIREKLTALFTRTELDFEHSKKFSRKFYVLTQDRIGLHEMLQAKNLDDLTRYPDMELEILGQELLFRVSRKAISANEAAIFSDLAKDLMRIFD